MKSNSSTSSFSFNENESVPIRRFPWAVLLLVGLVIVIELQLWRHTDWFADQAAWYWQAKSDLVQAGEVKGEFVVLGTSVTFHGLDPKPINDDPNQKMRVSNLALNGCHLQHQAQLLERYLINNQPPQQVMIELRDMTVPQDSWVSGPYWRFWASLDEIRASQLAYFEPNRLLEARSNRKLASFAYRRALDNWCFSSLRQRRCEEAYRKRNQQILQEMREHSGFSRGVFAQGLTTKDIPPREERAFEIDYAGNLWLHRILGTCRARKIKVVFFVPPAPSFVMADRQSSAYYVDLDNHVRDVAATYPDLEIQVFAPENYELSDFADKHHLSFAGSERVTRDFGRWLATLD